jgi:hypothetical protein
MTDPRRIKVNLKGLIQKKSAPKPSPPSQESPDKYYLGNAFRLLNAILRENPDDKRAKAELGVVYGQIERARAMPTAELAKV